MSRIVPVEAGTIDKLVGVYANVKDKKRKSEFFSKYNCLWMKNEAFGHEFIYVGNNTFEEASNPSGMYWRWRLHFEFLASGSVQLTETYTDDHLVKYTSIAVKEE